MIIKYVKVFNYSCGTLQTPYSALSNLQKKKTINTNVLQCSVHFQKVDLA